MADDFPLDGMPPLDPSPDEDAWEAFLLYALEHMSGNPDNSLSNRQIREVESVVGHQLPFELGMLLVLGVPDGDRWWRWNDNPAAQLAEWNARLLDGILFDVEQNNLWLGSWGPRPAKAADRTENVTARFHRASTLFPIYGHRAMPLDIAASEVSNDANPVLSIVQTDIVTYGADLAAWLHHEFEVPLPMWPPTGERIFPFWSDLM